jgi:hypothetical protein
VVTEIRIYFEGDKALRPGFHQFLSYVIEKAREQKVRFQLIAGKATAEADFQAAHDMHPDAWNILLQDSDGPNPGGKNSVCWMVQLMEAWFLADPEALERYYGGGFIRNALKQNPRVEEIPKADVLECLKEATRNTQKRHYHKTAHAPHILELLDPDKARKAAPECDRLFREILSELENDRAQAR